MTQYEPTIGLEIHCQINTDTKMFCRCSNHSFNEAPNTNICPICMALPGAKPIVNKEAVTKGMIAGLALNCTIPPTSTFDRKSYFYPDLPSGYQITQFEQPVAQHGSVIVSLSNGEEKTIRVNRLHLENDAGKLTHTAQGTLCDYNRAGAPLMEIVSEPDMHSIEEASQYAREIQRIMRYVNSSDADMEKGMMRFDLNISIKPVEQKEYGTKVEIKNLNSFQALEKAIEHEIKRQTKEIKAGNSIIEETRGWDDSTQKTVSQRSKEAAQDYRYFPDPDIPPLTVDQKTVQHLQETFIRELPYAKKKRFLQDFKLKEDEARILTETQAMANYFEEALQVCNNPKTLTAFITSILLRFLNENGLDLDDSKISAQHLGELIKAIDDGVISNNTAKGIVFETMFETGESPLKIIEDKGLRQESNTDVITELCQKAIEANPKAIEDYNNGNERALGAIIGFVMKESKGQANPALVNQTLKSLLDK